MTLQIEPLTDSAALERLTSEWEALDESLSPRTPFTSPAWNVLWWRHFRADRPLVRDTLRSFALRDETGRLVAVAPMMLTERPRVGRLRIRHLQFFGADPNLTELRRMICGPEHEDAAIAALMAHFHAHAAEWDWIYWGAIRQDGEAQQRLAAAPGTTWRRELPDYCLDLPGSWTELRAGLPRNIKESLRKCYNSLRREGYEPKLHVIEHAEAQPAALAMFFELHAARSAAPDLFPHPNLFAAPHARDFITDYANLLAQRGQLRIFQLEIGGAIVATRIGFAFGSELYLYYTGFDPTWSRFSVMTTLLAETVQWAISQRFTVINLSVGNDVSKTRWRPRPVTFREAVMTAPHAQGRIAHVLYDRLVQSARGPNPLARLIALGRRGSSGRR
jgi:CelD/BcsL family acetyltransferase involved in cellulose biosynthesis